MTPDIGSPRAGIAPCRAHAGLFERVKDDGRAEAALTARHGWLQRQGRAA